ncbi:probable cyclin-dependent serine/threonine-protein kinase DDB_G0292550 [Chenopodium quinoa]|uniref:probable cyclin-dependent serine/threonine-protein kinase DDB_G0292550 n=1 Tax=Chenopodium quinoa TaxID=63459 RepID=UPI000B782CC8|nr:probable cyclin-dependent serine/threonine-protein kinase DDB_G0292550 [Chenopodium quinoa]
MAGRNNNNNELNKVVRQSATVAQQLAARNNNKNPDPAGELFKKIAQSKPPTYQGEPGPIIIENWLREFDKLFVAEACLNESKEQVRDKFYPIFMQKQKIDEFLELKMGSMSTTEYYTKVIELSRFAEDIVATNRQKARRFERGLPLSLQSKLSGQVFDNLDELYGRAAHLHALELKEKAERAELEAREKRKELMTSSRPFGNQNNFKKQKFNNYQGNNFQNNRNNQGGRNFSKGNRNQPGDCNQRIYYCKRCSNNHPGKDCGGNLVTCNLCNKQGHRAYECFSKSKWGQGNNQFKGSGQNWNQQKGGQGSNGNQVNKGTQFQNGNKNTNGGNIQVKGGTPQETSSYSKSVSDIELDIDSDSWLLSIGKCDFAITPAANLTS